MQYRPEIDGLRGVAVLLVLFFHAGLPYITGGYIGVDVFFVISGYLITSIILSDIERGRFSYVGFYERRIRRILPALYVMSLLVLIVAFVTQVPVDLIKSAKTLAFALIFSSNIFFWRTTNYFSGNSDFEYFLHTWSLGVEEQFYFIFPLIILLLARNKRGLFYVALMACVGSFLVSVYASYSFEWAAYYLLPSRAWQMMVGALLAIYASSGKIISINKYSLNGLALLAAMLIFIPALIYTKQTRFPGLAALLPTFGAGLFIFLGLAYRGGLAVKVLGSSPLRSIGLISYSLYLWHWPVFAFLRNYQADTRLSVSLSIVGICLSLVLAYMSWRWVEAPFRNKERFSRRAIYTLAASATGVLLLMCLAVVYFDGVPSRLDPQVIRLSQFSESEVIDNPCVNKTANDIRGGNICYVGNVKVSPGVVISDPSIVLWGDSHMSALKAAFSESLQASQKVGAFIARTGCPPMPNVLKVGAGGGSRCVDFNQEVLEFVKSKKSIVTVVLHARWALNVEGSRYGAEQGPVYVLADKTASENMSNEAVVDRALNSLIAELLAANKSVVIISSVPEVGSSVPKVVANNIFWGKSLDVRPSWSGFTQRQKKTHEILSKIESRYSSVRVVYPEKVLCGTSFCRVMDGDTPLYFDDDHLSDHGAAMVVRQLEGLL
jgi:peptidoglycan/LPS O-acetylase OafA/YrhL